MHPHIHIHKHTQPHTHAHTHTQPHTHTHTHTNTHTHTHTDSSPCKMINRGIRETCEIIKRQLKVLSKLRETVNAFDYITITYYSEVDTHISIFMSISTFQ
jgi:hypothetical protein